MSTIHYTYVTGRNDTADNLEPISNEQAEQIFIEAAKRLGYTPVKFAGWDPRLKYNREEGHRAWEVACSIEGYSIAWHSYSEQVVEAESRRQPMTDDDALAIARASMGDAGYEG
jgi:hypothetical protein